MSEFSTIVYEVTDRVARITLNRVEVRNAQDKTMRYELNDAFDLAAQDDDVRVSVLNANGPHFASGHDLAEHTSRPECLRGGDELTTEGRSDEKRRGAGAQHPGRPKKIFGRQFRENRGKLS